MYMQKRAGRTASCTMARVENRDRDIARGVGNGLWMWVLRREGGGRRGHLRCGQVKWAGFYDQ